MDHGVERHDELANARGHGHLEGFAGLTQTVVEGPDGRIEAQRGDASHIKRAPHDGTTALNATLAGVLAAIGIERSNTGQRGDLAAVQ